MSKNPLTSNSNETLFRSSSSNESKTFSSRSSKNKNLTDLKSSLKSSVIPKTSLNSPSLFPSKPDYSCMNFKATIEKSPSAAIVSIDNIDTKENYSFETKLFSPQKKDNKRSFASLYNDKSLSILNRISNTHCQSKASQVKSPEDAYKGISNKKLKKAEVGNQMSTSVVEKDIRAPILVEPAKKSSLPMNLKLTLEKICGTGSSTHRIHLSPSPSESSSKLLSYKPKKSSRALGVEGKDGQGEKSRNDSKAKCKLNTLLTGLNKPLAELNRKPGKFSFREVNSVNATPRQGYKEAYSIIERGQAMNKFNGILSMLKDKNDETKRLSQTKSDLHSAQIAELKNIPETQNSFRERGSSYHNLKNSISEKHLAPEDSKIQYPSPNFMKSVYLYRKDCEITESKTPKMLSTSARFKNEFKCYSDRSGKSWITAIANSKAVRSPNKASSSGKEINIETKNEVSPGYEKSLYLKARDKEFRIQKNQDIPNTQKSIEHYTAPVDDKMLKRRASHDNEVENRKSIVKEGLDIGEALNQLKNRIERLLKIKSKEDIAKTNLIYQSLKEHFQKAI